VAEHRSGPPDTITAEFRRHYSRAAAMAPGMPFGFDVPGSLAMSLLLAGRLTPSVLPPLASGGGDPYGRGRPAVCCPREKRARLASENRRLRWGAY
jgi:hypothetical protein